MGLGKLIDMSETTSTQQLSVRMSEDMLAKAAELAEELAIPRSVVLREAFSIGMANLWSDWQQALQNGKEAKETAERSARTGGKPGKGQK